MSLRSTSTAAAIAIAALTAAALIFPIAAPLPAALAQLAPPPAQPKLPDREMVRRVGSLRIAHIKFEGSPLADALRAVTVAATAADPEKKGFNLVVMPQVTKETAETKIHLELRDVTAERALETLALLGGVELDYQKFAVIVSMPKKAAAEAPAPPAP
ncbi:hypothetical protein DB346_18165 [Verrucomicrobia bacterium LW23]|nr:hypothetical protein DB346_18165 [Verrucomicrobia bacterium LW23]